MMEWPMHPNYRYYRAPFPVFFKRQYNNVHTKLVAQNPKLIPNNNYKISSCNFKKYYSISFIIHWTMLEVICIFQHFLAHCRHKIKPQDNAEFVKRKPLSGSWNHIAVCGTRKHMFALILFELGLHDNFKLFNKPTVTQTGSLKPSWTFFTY